MLTNMMTEIYNNLTSAGDVLVILPLAVLFLAVMIIRLEFKK